MLCFAHLWIGLCHDSYTRECDVVWFTTDIIRTKIQDAIGKEFLHNESGGYWIYSKLVERVMKSYKKSLYIPIEHFNSILGCSIWTFQNRRLQFFRCCFYRVWMIVNFAMDRLLNVCTTNILPAFNSIILKLCEVMW